MAPDTDILRTELRQRGPRRGPRLWRSGAILLTIAAPLIAGCGGSSSTSTSTSSTAASAAGVARGVPDGSARHTTARIHADPVSNGVVVQRPKRGTGGNEVNDDNPGYADSGNGSATGQLDPCTLVSKAQAQSIIGHPIETPQEAPLGPTCIYQPVGAKSFVTMTVEAIDFSKLEPDIRDRRQLSIVGHAAYCGDYGQPTTFVPVGRGRVLSITAPCRVGAGFAAIALPRVPSPHPR
jgi:hypothetical protein